MKKQAAQSGDMAVLLSELGEQTLLHEVVQPDVKSREYEPSHKTSKPQTLKNLSSLSMVWQ